MLVMNMNNNDVQEKLLLNALNDNNTHNTQQQYNLNFDHSSNFGSNSRNHYQEQRIDHQNNYCEHDRTQTQENYEPYDIEAGRTSSGISIGSLTPEEFLENFEHIGNIIIDDNNNDTMSTDASIDDCHLDRNTIQKAEKITSTNISWEDSVSVSVSVSSSKNKNKDKNCKASIPSTDGASTTPRRRQSKSAGSDASSIGSDGVSPFQVETPTDNDILCGQSRVCAIHPGNQFFQRVLDDYTYSYNMATTKQEKMQITKAIVASIHERGGRFLKQRKDGVFEEISTVAARDKVSHALRTKVASQKRTRQQQHELQFRASLTPDKRSSLSRSSIQVARQSRRSSNRSVTSCPEALRSDLAPIPFDGHETSESILSGLMQSQKEIYAAMGSLQNGYHNQSNNNNNNNNNNYNNSNNNNNDNDQHYHRRSLPTYPGNHFHSMER